MDAMTLKPRVSEKAYAQSQTLNVFVFQVPVTANKHTVAQAVSDQFKVTVTNVNIVSTKGKVKRTVRQGGRSQAYGKRSDTKKAYVTLKSGDSIPVFANEEDKKSDGKPKAAKKEKK